MPTSALAFCLPPTYTALAGSSPTRIVASPGDRPCSSVNAFTCSATCARTRAATALPSMIWAAMEAGTLPPRRGCTPAAESALADRRVLGHELALGAVAREAYDDDPAGLDARHDALAERRVDAFVAHAVVGAGRVRARLRPRRDPRADRAA